LKALSFAILVSACGGSQPAEKAGPADSQPDTGTPVEEESEPYEIAVVPKGLVHQFWLTVKAGAEAAAEEEGAEILWKGPNKETEVARQISIIEDMITRGVDAIVMAACDANSLIGVVDQAVAADIPVVTIDSGVKSEAPVTLVATDNVAGAKAAADTLAELVGGEGQVGLIPFVAGAATSEQREAGFKEGLEAWEDIKLVSTLYSESQAEIAMEKTEDMLTAHPELGGIFAANEAGALGAVQAIEAAGKAGEVKLVAFDAAKGELAALRRGTIQALIVQNPFAMGFEGVKAAVKALEGESVEPRIDTGVTVVTLDNLDTPEVQELLNPLGE
jgi:ribose transport system substrate-binding protein